MSARELLTQLLDYIEEQAKNVNPRAYRLASFKEFLKRRADLAGLPGVEFNLSTEGDHLWLRVQRLYAAPPPDIDGSVKGLIRITSDPSGPVPSIDEAAFSLRIVEITTGAPAEERAELESQERLRVDQWLATYSALWRAWAEGEKPRRRSRSVWRPHYEGDAFATCLGRSAVDVERAAREQLVRPDARPVTPFDPGSHADVLKLAARNLDGRGTYVPLAAIDDAVPPPGEQLRHCGWTTISGCRRLEGVRPNLRTG